MNKPYKIKSINESLKDDITSGVITLQETALELYRSGWFNYIPDEEATREHLNITEGGASNEILES